jgi:DNA-binding HxlR family transcriptional regulator
MPLGTDYAQQNCAIARSLEVVGERWTLLIIRDLFYGVRRYSDLQKHIGLPPATLTARLGSLVAEDVVERVPGSSGRDEYVLTAKGQSLWPVISTLAHWGNTNYVEPANRMQYMHRTCGGLLNEAGACESCGVIPGPEDVAVQRPEEETTDPFAVALREPHRLLTPLRV